MEYDYIEIEKDGNYLKFYFKDDIDSDAKRWFYEFKIKNEKDIERWNEHLSHKMWYTPEVRARVLNYAKELMHSKKTNTFNFD
jgi:hypothetical protein